MELREFRILLMSTFSPIPASLPYVGFLANLHGSHKDIQTRHLAQRQDDCACTDVATNVL